MSEARRGAAALQQHRGWRNRPHVCALGLKEHRAVLVALLVEGPNGRVAQPVEASPLARYERILEE